MAYTPKKAATESKNKTQYSPVDFFLVVVVITRLIFGKYKADAINAPEFVKQKLFKHIK
jgi:hypothetical protein